VCSVQSDIKATTDGTAIGTATGSALQALGDTTRWPAWPALGVSGFVNSAAVTCDDTYQSNDPEPAARTNGVTTRSTWVDVTGVYTPTSGQNHALTCDATCATTACSSISGLDAVIITKCSGCLPQNPETDVGCFPGAAGFPSEPSIFHAIAGLQSGKYYKFRVAAYNTYGTADWSDASYALHLHTVPNQPTWATTAVTAAALDGTGLTLNWVAPDNFGIGTDACASQTARNSVTLGCAQSSAALFDACDKDDDKSISTAEASNCACISGSGAIGSVTITTETCSTAGTGADNSASLSRSAAKVVAVNGATSTVSMTYEVLQCAVVSPATTCTPVSKSSTDPTMANIETTSKTITGLIAGTKYIFAIKASNAAGAGAASVTTAYTTAAVPAQPVAAPVATALTDAAVTVSWGHVLDQVPDGTKLGQTSSGYSSGFVLYAQSCNSVGLAAGTPCQTSDKTHWSPASRGSLTHDGGDTIAAAENAANRADSATNPDVAYSTDSGSTTLVDSTTGTWLKLSYFTSQQFTVGASELPPSVFTGTGPITITDASPSASEFLTAAGTLHSSLKAGQKLRFVNKPGQTCGTTTTVTVVSIAGAAITVSGTVGTAANCMITRVPADTYTTTFTAATTDCPAASTGRLCAVDTVSVPMLSKGTQYRFMVAFVNAVGTSTTSAASVPVTTLDSAVSDLRIYSGPPCVYQSTEPNRKTTFAASASGTNVKYSWELVTQAQTGTSVLYTGNYAAPGGSSVGTCLDGDRCSVMEYEIPYPGSDGVAPNYDEIKIRVLAYNTRGIVTEELSFGYVDDNANGASTNDLNTVEYCGCTDPTDENYWAYATYMIPTTCKSGIAFAGSAASPANAKRRDNALGDVTSISSGAWEYFQFFFDVDTYAAEVTLRVDVGSVDVYVGTEGVPDYNQAHTYSSSQTGVSNFFVTSVDYAALSKSATRSVYVAVKGAGGFSRFQVVGRTSDFKHGTHGTCNDASQTTEATCTGNYDLSAQGGSAATARVWNTRKVLVDQESMSGTCTATDNTNRVHRSACAAVTNLQTKTACAAVTGNPCTYAKSGLDGSVRAESFHFYEFYYPHAENDIDVQLTVETTAAATAGGMQVYASTTERYPSPERKTDAYDGYWLGTGHTGAVNSPSGTFTYTLRPQSTKGKDGALYIAIKGNKGSGWSLGDALPVTPYTLKVKTFVYRIESALLEPGRPLGVTNSNGAEATDSDQTGGVATDEDRYSVVSADNFNYYEVKISRATFKLAFKLTVHYGTVKVFSSSTSLPTQDESLLTNAAGTEIGAVKGPYAASASAQTFDLTYNHLNVKDGYVYVGIISTGGGEASYDIEVTEHTFGVKKPTDLYLCDANTPVGSTSGVSTTVAIDAACTTLPGCTTAVNAASNACKKARFTRRVAELPSSTFTAGGAAPNKVLTITGAIAATNMKISSSDLHATIVKGQVLTWVDKTANSCPVSGATVTADADPSGLTVTVTGNTVALTIAGPGLTGAVKAGDAVVQATSAATGTVTKDASLGGTTVVITVATGAFSATDAITITATSGSVTGTPTAIKGPHGLNLAAVCDIQRKASSASADGMAPQYYGDKRDSYTFFQLYIGARDAAHESAARTAAGAMPADISSDPDSWGLDWSTPYTQTWIDSKTDEWDLDVDVALTGMLAPHAGDIQAYQVFASSRERYPSTSRAFDTAVVSATVADGAAGGSGTRTTLYSVAGPAGHQFTLSSSSCSAVGAVTSQADVGLCMKACDTAGDATVCNAFVYIEDGATNTNNCMLRLCTAFTLTTTGASITWTPYKRMTGASASSLILPHYTFSSSMVYLSVSLPDTVYDLDGDFVVESNDKTSSRALSADPAVTTATRCTSSYCNNNGKCIDDPADGEHAGGAYCVCDDNWTGDRCDVTTSWASTAGASIATSSNFLSDATTGLTVATGNKWRPATAAVALAAVTSNTVVRLGANVLGVADYYNGYTITLDNNPAGAAGTGVILKYAANKDATIEWTGTAPTVSPTTSTKYTLAATCATGNSFKGLLVSGTFSSSSLVLASALDKQAGLYVGNTMATLSPASTGTITAYKVTITLTMQGTMDANVAIGDTVKFGAITGIVKTNIATATNNPTMDVEVTSGDWSASSGAVVITTASGDITENFSANGGHKSGASPVVTVSWADTTPTITGGTTEYFITDTTCTRKFWHGEDASAATDWTTAAPTWSASTKKCTIPNRVWEPYVWAGAAKTFTGCTSLRYIIGKDGRGTAGTFGTSGSVGDCQALCTLESGCSAFVWREVTGTGSGTDPPAACELMSCPTNFVPSTTAAPAPSAKYDAFYRQAHTCCAKATTLYTASATCDAANIINGVYDEASCTTVVGATSQTTCEQDSDLTAVIASRTATYGTTCATAGSVTTQAACEQKPFAELPDASCPPEALAAGYSSCDAFDKVLLDCSSQKCTPTGTNPYKVGYVTCPGGVCTINAPKPIISIPFGVKQLPARSKVVTYVDSNPYPSQGANAINYVNHCPSSDKTCVAKGVTGPSFDDSTVKIYDLKPLGTGKKHTLVLMLLTDSGEPLGTQVVQFQVGYSGGCAVAPDGSVCGGHGACYLGYCVCYDGWYGNACQRNVEEDGSTCSLQTGQSKSLCEGASNSAKSFTCTWSTPTVPVPSSSTTDAAGTCTASLSTVSGFKAGDVYEKRVAKLAQSKLGEARFLNTRMLEASAAAIAKSNTALTSKTSSTSATLQSHATTVQTTLTDTKAATQARVDALYAKAERNAIVVQQAREESLRSQTSNLEAKLELQRALADHQTQVQNRFQSKRFGVYKLNAMKQDKLKQEFARSRFTINQLKTANGPTVDTTKFKESTCTTDQFYNVVCTETTSDKSSSYAGNGYVSAQTVENTQTTSRTSPTVTVNGATVPGTYSGVNRG
jgi:hypothetical protein